MTHELSLSAPTPPPPPKFPADRETVYVIDLDSYRASNHVLQIQIATRPTATAPTKRTPAKSKRKATIYRRFSAGVDALAASADALDREVAQKISLSSTISPWGSTQELRIHVPMDSSADLIGKLARSGKLFLNKDYHLHDGIVPVGWLCDEPFDLKFQIAPCDAELLSLGICAAAGQVRVPQEQLKQVHPRYFLDEQNRLGLFRNQAAPAMLRAFEAGRPIRVPRSQTAELLERVLNFPGSPGVEFVDCQELQPARVGGTAKPRIRFKAGSPGWDEILDAEIHFDYEGVTLPLHGRLGAEFYDKTRGQIVQIDTALHEQSVQLLESLGAKVRPRSDGVHVMVAKRKLPAVVSQLIHHGWHVEAEDKLYRTGSRFELNLVSGIDWFELQGTARFDDAAIDLPRLLRALRTGERTVLLDDGSIGLIPDQWLQRLGTLAELTPADADTVRFGKSQVGLLDALLAQQTDAVAVDEQFAAARAAVQAFDRVQPQDAPAGFAGTLRPYQQLALGWFAFLRHLGFGGCLADDMGLGKTVQVLALLEERRQQKCGPSLIVVPRSLIFNWTAEAARFAPQLRVLDQSHAQRRKETQHLSDFDLVLTTYGTLRRDAAFLKDFEFDYVVLDESQAIKNSATEVAKAVRLLRGRHKLALSGTPIENHLGELWSLFDFLNPGMLGRVGRFAKMARDASADDRQLLAAAVRPFLLRRTKRQVAPELPERVEQTLIVELDPEHRRAYDELRDYYRTALMTRIETDGIGKSQIIILEALLRLRQAACHPGLVDKARVGEPSAKLEELATRLSAAVEAGERVLVFSQFTSLLAIVRRRLKQAKIDFLYLDGKTKDRQSLVEQFQSGTGPGVFLISLKAGGVGLNLTAARTVYLLDPWWNPAVEAQAIDRTHRIGQQQVVFATRLIASDTVEQKVLELQAKKKGLADAIVNADTGGISSLTREDLQLLLA